MAEKDEIVLYMTTMSSSLQVKKNCQKICTIMESVKNSYNFVQKDVCAEGQLAAMRAAVGDPTSLPPQLCSEKFGYLGGYDTFTNAVEDSQLENFLKKEYEYVE